MHSMKRHLAAAGALALVVAAVAGSALGAPPNEQPPGQEKKAEEATQPAQQPAPQPAQRKGSAPGQEKKSSAATTKSTGINSTSSGVKPGNSTKKGTSCKTGGGTGSSATCTGTETSAASTSDHSKRYGNGKTAAQIANTRGAPAGTEIRGPGNSQPHKVCKKVNKSGKSVWVDVHAVKNYDNNCAAAPAQQPGVTPQAPGPGPTVVSGAPAAGPAAAPAAGGVAGVSVTAPAGGEAGGVAGAFAQVGGVAVGTLPFTGLPLWAVVLVGLVAIATGPTLWRRSRPALRDVV